MGDSDSSNEQPARAGRPPKPRSKPAPAAHAKTLSSSGAAQRISIGELRRLRTLEDVRAERERLYDKLDHADHRLVGELVDRQIKILRMVQEDCGGQELRDRLDKLEASNRELAARIAGGAGGSAVIRADAAPSFVIEGSSGAH